MSEERKLKSEGEELAKIAVSSGMGAKQLQTVYSLVKSRTLAFVEAYVERQIGREVRGLAGFMKILELCLKYKEEKHLLEKVLMYAVMLYDYVVKQPTLSLIAAGEPAIKGVVEGRGLTYEGVTMSLHGRDLEVKVKVRGSYGPPKPLANDIERALKGKREFENLNLRVWIE